MLQVTPLGDVESPSEEAFSRVQTHRISLIGSFIKLFQITVMELSYLVKQLPLNENVSDTGDHVFWTVYMYDIEF